MATLFVQNDGHGEDGALRNHFNYRGFGNFFAQIGADSSVERESA